MAKIKIGKAPSNFKRKVTIDLLGGGQGDVEFSFIYRKRSEYGTMLEESLASEKRMTDEYDEWMKSEQDKINDKSQKLAEKEAEKKQITDKSEIDSLKTIHMEKLFVEFQKVAVEKVVNNNIDLNVQLLKKMVDGWDLEDEFNDENIKWLIDTYPAIITDAKEIYRKALTEGRTKN